MTKTRAKTGVNSGLGALVRQVEELDDGGDVVVDAQLLEHPHVRDPSLEGRDNLRVGLHGLITCLCTRYPAVTPGEAMLRLQLAGANLQIAPTVTNLER